jgi:hypothetical protein
MRNVYYAASGEDVVKVQMTEASQDELILTITLAAGWMIRAIEEYGVGGSHMPDTVGFLAASQGVLAKMHEQLLRLGAVPEGQSMTLVQVIQHVHAKVKGGGS